MYTGKLGILKPTSDFYSANRKRADARKTGGGPPPPRLTEAEELAMSQTVGRPVAEGIPGGTSSSDMVTQEPPALIRCNRPRPQTSFGPIVQC